MSYGKAPEEIGCFDLDWDEYMHYMYLPVVMPYQGHGWRLPERLKFVQPLLTALYSAAPWGRYQYVYVTARRGFATPNNPLNRPGWHCDGFGTDDVNYIWTDAFPTRYATGDLDPCTDDHMLSIEAWNRSLDVVRPRDDISGIAVHKIKLNTLYRLDPFVIHSTPKIPAPGGERGFIKISFSNEKYNLKGNSHNYLFDYDWKMWDRAELRNDPAYAGGDAGPQEMAA